MPERRSYKQDNIIFMGEFFNHEHIHCQKGEVTNKTLSLSLVNFSIMKIFIASKEKLQTRQYHFHGWIFQSWKYSLPARRGYKQDNIIFMGEFFNHENIHCQLGEVTNKTLSFSWVNFSTINIRYSLTAPRIDKWKIVWTNK